MMSDRAVQGRLIPFYFGKLYQHRLRPTPQEYDDIRNVCLDILHDFPPELSTFIAIGRSPTALAAFFSQCPQVRLLSIPGSLGLRKDRMDAALRQRLAKVLQQIEGDRKNVVLLDYCLSGATLTTFVGHAQELLKDLGLPFKIKSVALAHDPLQANCLQPLVEAGLVRIYPLETYPTLRKFLFREAYDRLAEYQPSKDHGFERNSLIYEAYCRNMAECMAFDSAMALLSVAKVDFIGMSKSSPYDSLLSHE